MKFNLSNTSDNWNAEPSEIEISTLEELMKLLEECGSREIIIGKDDVPYIEIYDDYRE